jgi:hypothetical protein
LLPPPIRRDYSAYVRSAKVAERNTRRKAAHDATRADKQLSTHSGGVYGLWSLHILPYAANIHWTVDMMHTFNNVIKDMLDSIRPTVSATPGLYYKHVNRTYKDSVLEKCHDEGIHNTLTTSGEVPPWVLSKKECMSMDRQMMNVIGAHRSDEVSRFVMRSGGTQKSHDTIRWAQVFGEWILRDQNSYIDNIRDIIHSMWMLNCSRMTGAYYATDVMSTLITKLVVRGGLVPPSECCVTLHELVHICEQVNEVGVPRHSTLYKFEKMNKVMKGFLKNQARGLYYLILLPFLHQHYLTFTSYYYHIYLCLLTLFLIGFASICKNYCEHEQHSFHFSSCPCAIVTPFAKLVVSNQRTSP